MRPARSPARQRIPLSAHCGGGQSGYETKYLFLTGTEPYGCEESFSLLVERVESLISVENTTWSKSGATESSSKQPADTDTD